MCELLDRVEEKGRQRGLAEGRLQMLFDLVRNNKIPIKDAAEVVSMTSEEFKERMEEFS